MHETDAGDRVVLESVYVEMDPVLDGFAGAVVEIVRDEDSYVLLETAVTTGNRLLRFTSTDLTPVQVLFDRHVQDFPRWR